MKKYRVYDESAYLWEEDMTEEEFKKYVWQNGFCCDLIFKYFDGDILVFYKVKQDYT